MNATIVSALILGSAIGVPLAILAVLMIRNRRSALTAEQLRRYEAFSAILARVEAKEIGAAQKIVAVRQLRNFPEYADLIVLMCNSIDVNGTGPGVEVFQNELRLTEQHLLKAIP
ncbi:MAG: hypothetical protein AAF205_00965 [Pseudomonadota bacterium]